MGQQLTSLQRRGVAWTKVRKSTWWMEVNRDGTFEFLLLEVDGLRTGLLWCSTQQTMLVTMHYLQMDSNSRIDPSRLPSSYD